MQNSLPDFSVFYIIEQSLKEYRRLCQSNISKTEIDITVDQSLVLLFINQNPSLPQKELAKLVFKETPSLTRIIEIMVKKEYLTRTMHPEDRRRFHLELSKKGKSILKLLKPIIKENRQTALRGFTKNELSTLNKLMCKVIANCKRK